MGAHADHDLERVVEADYRIQVRGNERLYHANLLKKYTEREVEVVKETNVMGETRCW